MPKTFSMIAVADRVIAEWQNAYPEMDPLNYYQRVTLKKLILTAMKASAKHSVAKLKRKINADFAIPARVCKDCGAEIPSDHTYCSLCEEGRGIF